MTLKLDISPCPNDTFMFDALINGRIDTCGLQLSVGYYDIEQLNLRAQNRKADITKVSYATLPLIADKYTLCDSGSALGRGNGPLLVCRVGQEDFIKECLSNGETLRIAVPGFHTTANLLMDRLFPRAEDKTEVLFSEIALAVSAGGFHAGVLIHEGRFTYADHGLEKVFDLGLEWESRTGLPLPLGGIAVARDIARETADRFAGLLRRSIEFAFDNPGISRQFVKAHAREIDDKVIDSHIALFVNEFSISLGRAGQEAIRELTGLEQAAFL